MPAAWLFNLFAMVIPDASSAALFILFPVDTRLIESEKDLYASPNCLVANMLEVFVFIFMKYFLPVSLWTL